MLNGITLHFVSLILDVYNLVECTFLASTQVDGQDHHEDSNQEITVHSHLREPHIHVDPQAP